jgi:succinoglycan biosynthesis transport protein ExoP
MSIVQFARILWARRWMVILTTVATTVGALIAVLIIPPSYTGKTRVMLNTLKPDPITGEMMQNAAARTYVATQMELIRDIGVAGRAADDLGWTSNSQAINRYNAQKSEDTDMRRAMAQRIIDRTQVDLVPATNILEIGFRAATANDARQMANSLREAYIQATLDSRRREATRNADWYMQQVEKERDLLNKADAAKNDYERSNGIVMQDDTVDIETARLRALAGAGALGGAIAAPSQVPQTSPATIQLAELDARIAQASKTLGPNHPAMVQLKAERVTLAEIAAKDEARLRATASSASRAMNESAGAMSRAVAQQTSRVIANRDKIERLHQLQAEVNLHRAQMDKALARTGELRQQAAVADSGITVLSEAVTPRDPSFPNKPLIFGGGLFLGLGFGLLLSLLLELLRRRVRGFEDLQHVVDAPMLAVISTESGDRKKALSKPRKSFFPRRRRPAVA